MRKSSSGWRANSLPACLLLILGLHGCAGQMPAAPRMRALIYDAMGDTTRADESFRQALAVDPNNGSVLHNNAWSLCRRGQYDAADALFARAAALPQPGLGSKTLLARGVCQQRAGDLKAAEKTLLKAYEF